MRLQESLQNTRSSISWIGWPRNRCTDFVSVQLAPPVREKSYSAPDYMFRYQRFVFKHNMYKLREERNIKPSTFGQLVSSTLYEKRYDDSTVTPGISVVFSDSRRYLHADLALTSALQS